MSKVETEIVGPFKERKLVVDGWSVPFLTACELDGGRVALTVDHRFGIEVEAAALDDVAWLLAQLAAVSLGYRYHPSGDGEEAIYTEQFAHIPHPSLAPRHMVEIKSPQRQEAGR